MANQKAVQNTGSGKTDIGIKFIANRHYAKRSTAVYSGFRLRGQLYASVVFWMTKNPKTIFLGEPH